MESAIAFFGGLAFIAATLGLAGAIGAALGYERGYRAGLGANNDEAWRDACHFWGVLESAYDEH